ncbi:MAG: DUF2628 domain-containing protein, partial [Rhodobacteraceae bacterium]
ADGVIFVKDGFSWPAFLIPFFWLIWHRLWWGLAGYVIAVAGLAGIGYLAGFPDGLGTSLGLLLNVYLGLEGNNLRRKALARRGYQEVADVVAGDSEEAAWRFLANRMQHQGS